MRNTRTKMIDFMIAILKERFIEGRTNISYGHDFNSMFNKLDNYKIDINYMALCLMLEFYNYQEWRFELLIKWLEENKLSSQIPTLYDNKNLVWNLYYAIKLINPNE